ncbi:MAG: carboxypeptidase-like regulatory domain-containing protein [Pirellulaceae bacterium]
MRFQTASRHVVVILATAVISIPQIAYAGNGPRDTTRPATPAIQDVALSVNGQLSGQLLNRNGSPVGASKIQLQHNGKPIATVTTNRSGHFVIDGVHAGLYQVTSDRASGIYRVWTAEGAPPAAQSRVLLVDDGRVVRARGGGNMKNMLLVGGLVITAGVIGGVIGYNIRDVDDAS